MKSWSLSTIVLGVSVIGTPAVISWAEETDLPAPMLSPLTIAPSTQTAPATSAPSKPTHTAVVENNAGTTVPPSVPVAATQAAATQSAEAVMQQLLHPVPTASNTLSGTPTVIPAIPGIAPIQPAVVRMREGDTISQRVGRLIKDEKTQQWVFAFESDGKAMKDPPMGLIPSKFLSEMEELSEKGTKPIKFRVSGEVTEYHGKNYLYVKFAQAVRDMNQF